MKIFARFIPVAALVFTVACGRTDAGITTDVKTRLAADDAVKAYQVDVARATRWSRLAALWKQLWPSSRLCCLRIRLTVSARWSTTSL